MTEITADQQAAMDKASLQAKETGQPMEDGVGNIHFPPDVNGVQLVRPVAPNRVTHHVLGAEPLANKPPGFDKI